MTPTRCLPSRSTICFHVVLQKQQKLDGVRNCGDVVHQHRLREKTNSSGEGCGSHHERWLLSRGFLQRRGRNLPIPPLLRTKPPCRRWPWTPTTGHHTAWPTDTNDRGKPQKNTNVQERLTFRSYRDWTSMLRSITPSQAKQELTVTHHDPLV